MIYFEYIIILWLALQFKNILFWLYLWQLKNYYTPRFSAHFSTHQGKNLVMSIHHKIKFIMIGLLAVSLLVGIFSAVAELDMLHNVFAFIGYYYLILGVHALYSLIFGKASRILYSLKKLKSAISHA